MSGNAVLLLRGALCAFVVLMLLRAPVLGAPEGTQGLATVQGVAAKLRAHARTIAELKAAALQAEELMSTIRDVNQIMRPLIPGLRRIADSRALKSLEEVPYVGVPAKTVRVSADLLEALGRTLVALEEQDRKTSEKLRRAIFATDRFLQTERREDLRELVASYDQAVPVMEGHIASNRKALTALEASDRVLVRVLRMKPLLKAQNAALAASLEDLRVALNNLRRALILADRAFRGTVAFMREVSRDGHRALAQ